MQYDIALKSLFSRSTGGLLENLAGSPVVRWLPTELSQAARHVDLLAETADGRLIHFELQSKNDRFMALRMVEYSGAICRRWKRFPEQIVLYVGERAMRMKSVITSGHSIFQYRLVDVRTLNGKDLLDSPEVEDNVIAILTKGGGNRSTLRRIIEKIALLDNRRRDEALKQLFIISGLRRLEDTLKQEVRRMPIQISIRDNKFLAEAFRNGRKEGVKQQSLRFLKHMIKSRFGALPPWVDERIQGLSVRRMETLGTRIHQCETLEDLFGKQPKSLRS